MSFSKPVNEPKTESEVDYLTEDPVLSEQKYINASYFLTTTNPW
jgi:hypothetical protein